MSEPGSVTVWLAPLRAGDAAAAERLWEGYYRRLVALARQKLRGQPRAAADEEDVALSAFDSFFQGIQQGRFPRLEDRGDLWQVLVMLTARKAWRQTRYEQRDRRDWRRAQHASALEEEEGAVEVIGGEPTPEFAALLAEECRRLLEALGDEQLRAVALGKMEGYTNEELAARLDCAPRTIDRRLGRIRSLWSQEGTP
jgi:DNA-directed RNA polymerase specialized sigma24 family protein